MCILKTMRCRWQVLLCTPILVVVMSGPSAVAQDGGIQVDPDSPSGTEYKLPLEGARQDAQRDHGRDAGPGSPAGRRPAPAPAFGEGIETPAADATTKRDGERSRGERSEGDGETAGSGGTEAATGTNEAQATTPSSTTKRAKGPGSALLAVGVIAAGLLVAGAAIGVLIRRHARAE